MRKLRDKKASSIKTSSEAVFIDDGGNSKIYLWLTCIITLGKNNKMLKVAI